jgi:DNA invertase Pin-like site-specific DNA recombinase
MSQFNFPPDMVGFSLIRFSNRRQADGDSYRRQVAAAEGFAREEGIVLDISLHEADIRKLGISGFSGKHVIKGPIRRFIAGIENGTVKPGKSLLLVSEWNRLTRQVSSDALKLTIDFMERGIGIVDLQDRSYYTLDRYNEDLGLQMSLQVKISMAHQYSKNLSHFLTAKWEARRQAAMAGTAKANNACPGWLKAVDGKFHVIQDRLTTIEQIKKYRLIGLGAEAIATRLNGTGIPAFRSKRGWHARSVRSIIESRALLGFYQPIKGRTEKIGDPIPGFYPIIMSEDDWWRMQWPKDGRKSARGRKSAKVKNLLAGVVHCRQCAEVGRQGGVLVYENKGRGRECLICDNSRRGFECTDRTRHSYSELETEILAAFALLDFSRLIDKSHPETERIAALEKEIVNKSAMIEGMAEGFGPNAPPAFFRRAQMLQADIDAAKVRLDETRRAARTAEAHSGKDCYALFRAMVARLPDLQGDELYETRTRILTELRRIIETAWADGESISIELIAAPWHRLAILIKQSRIVEFCLISYRTNGVDCETRIIFPRDVLIRPDGTTDITGVFAEMIGKDVA